MQEVNAFQFLVTSFLIDFVNAYFHVKLSICALFKLTNLASLESLKKKISSAFKAYRLSLSPSR